MCQMVWSFYLLSLLLLSLLVLLLLLVSLSLSLVVVFRLCYFLFEHVPDGVVLLFRSLGGPQVPREKDL